jgi:tRNA G18 (ribose-2'-O)-methylase SpoU
MSEGVTADDPTQGNGAAGTVFYVCCAATCGLRFPVNAGEKWRERCPHCGSSVAPVARVAEVRPEIHAHLALTAPAPEVHLLLDNWRSLFNVGSALRTADGAGVAHVYLCGITATPMHPKLAKTALGAEQSVPWSYHADAVRQAAALKAQGAQLWVLEETAEAEPIGLVKRTGMQPIVLAAGNEVAGVDPGLLALADRTLVIPMRGVKRSLNVAVATGIALYLLSL